MNPRFSIIIPVFNVENYLHQCLDSVIEQDFDNYEVICVNDGSTDESPQILKEYEQKYNQIKVIHQTNKGLSAARNRGINASKGDYILFLDSDDWLETNALSILKKNLSDEDLLCFSGSLFYEDSGLLIKDSGYSDTNLSGWEYYNKYVTKPVKFHFVCVVLRLYRRDYLFKNKLFFKEGIFHEDNLFTPLACYFANKVSVINESLYVYRQRVGSIMGDTTFKRLQDLIETVNYLAEFFSNKVGMEKKYIYKYLASAYISAFSVEKTLVYGNRDAEISRLINWRLFRLACVNPRHFFLFNLIRLHPSLFRFYTRLVKII